MRKNIIGLFIGVTSLVGFSAFADPPPQIHFSYDATKGQVDVRPEAQPPTEKQKVSGEEHYAPPAKAPDAKEAPKSANPSPATPSPLEDANP